MNDAGSNNFLPPGHASGRFGLKEGGKSNLTQTTPYCALTHSLSSIWQLMKLHYKGNYHLTNFLFIQISIPKLSRPTIHGAGIGKETIGEDSGGSAGPSPPCFFLDNLRTFILFQIGSFVAFLS